MTSLESFFLLCCQIIVFIFTVLSMKSAWAPPKKSSKHDCKQCNYSLVGIEPTEIRLNKFEIFRIIRCPECGNEVGKTVWCPQPEPPRSPVITAVIFDNDRMVYDVDRNDVSLLP